MIRPECCYTSKEAMAALDVSVAVFRRIRPRPIGRMVVNGKNLYMGTELIAAWHRFRGAAPPDFACVTYAGTPERAREYGRRKTSKEAIG